MKCRLHLLLPVCCCILLLQTHAQPAGSLDPAFANSGIGIYSMGKKKTNNEVAQDIILQPDGKLIVAGTIDGRMAILRLNADQTVDAGFGQDGIVFIKKGISSMLVSAVLQPDGKILFVGNNDNGSYHDFLIVRLNSNGSMDNSFDSDGKLLIASDTSYINLNAVVLQSNGKIVLAGRSGGDFLAMRLNSNGSMDSSFDSDGKARIPLGKYGDYANSVTVQPDGKILLAGVSYRRFNHHDEPDFSVVRLSSNGSLDNSFSKDGKVVILVDSSYDFAQSMVLQPDGKILVAGYRHMGSNNHFDFVVMRLNKNGTLDTSFNNTGKLMFFGATGQSRTPIALEPDGKILLVGAINSGDGGYPMDLLIARLNSNGTLDSSFNSDGLAHIYHDYDDIANSIVLQPDGEILVAGSNSYYYYDSFLILRVDNNGYWDNSFSTYWIEQEEYASTGRALCTALQTDGRILLAGYSTEADDLDFSVMRLNRNGIPDSSFDGDGKLRIPGHSYGDGFSETASSIAVQSDGKILLAGNSSYFYDEQVLFGVMRLNSNGSIDSSFNGVGKERVPGIGNNLEVSSMALQRDGKILLAGNSSNENNDLGFCLVRLNSNGSLDNSFDGDGKLWLQAGASNERVFAIAIQPDGKLLLAGYSNNANDADFLAVRLNSNGSLDSSFKGDGKIIIPGAYNDIVYSIALQPDGKILLAGTSAGFYGGSFFSAVRLNSDGSLDNTFGNGGKVLMSVGTGSDDLCSSVVLQPTGKILLTGFSKNGGNEDFCLVRINSNGSPDSSFNGNGKVVVSTPSPDHANASVLQPDGNIIIAGYGEGDIPGDNFIAMRILGCTDGNCSPVKIKIDNVAVEEGNTGAKTMNFLVRLSGVSSQTVTVDYTTQNGTAKSLNDYVAKTGTLIFHPGIIKKKISVTINGDTEMEPDETFKVNLSNAVNATIVDARGVGTIQNDDAATIASGTVSDAWLEERNKQSMSISPNPADAVMKVQLFGYTGKVTLQLQNLQAKILKQEKLQVASFHYAQCSMNIASLASGVYLIHVFDEHGEQRTEKVMVIR